MSSVLCTTVIYRSAEIFRKMDSGKFPSLWYAAMSIGKYFPAFQRRSLPLEDLISLLFFDPEKGGSKLSWNISTIYKSTWHSIPAHLNLYSHHCEKLRSWTDSVLERKKILFFSDDAWVTLSTNINSQNNRLGFGKSMQCIRFSCWP